MTDNNFNSLNADEVVRIPESFKLSIDNTTFTVQEFCERIAGILADYAKYSGTDFNVFWDEDQGAWFGGQGIPCEALRFDDRAWRSGRVRLTLEFCPDPPEEETVDVPLLTGTTEDSPLDEIRRLSDG